MRIVHLSDFHLSKNTIDDLENFMKGALIEDLILFHNKSKIDLILYTGDLINQGGSDFNSIEEAFEQFESLVIDFLLKELKMNKNQFFFVPGNHDIDRSADSSRVEKGMTQELISIESISQQIKNVDNLEGIRRILPFKKFEKSFFEDYKEKEITNYNSVYKIDIDGIKIGIAAFNSAWRCYNSAEDQNKILVGMAQIGHSKSYLRECDMKIALMHHHPSFLSEIESDNIESSIERDYDLLLCGHTHKSKTFERVGFESELITSIAPANAAINLWEDSIKFVNGYNLIDFFADGKCTVNHRKYAVNLGEYVGNTDLSKHNGIISFQTNKKLNEILSEKKESSKKKIEFDINKDQIENISITNTTINDSYYETLSKEWKIENSKQFIIISNVLNKYKTDLEKLLGIKNSEHYSNDSVQSSIYMIDKLLLHFEYKNYLFVTEFIENLSEVIEGILKSDDFIPDLEKVYFFIEWWFEKLNYILFHAENSFSVEDFFKLLNLEDITTKEVENEDYKSVIWDSAKDTWVCVQNKQYTKIKLKTKQALIDEILLCFIFPIYKNINILKKKRDFSNINEYYFNNTNELFEYIQNEEQWNYMIGNIRKNEIEEVYEIINNSKIAVVESEKDAGKTALLYYIFKDSIKNKNFGLIAIFSFKYSTNLLEMLKNIIDQCNSQLINQIDLEYMKNLLKDKSFSVNEMNLNKYEILNDDLQVLIFYFEEIVKRVNLELGSLLLIIDSTELINDFSSFLNMIENLNSCFIILSNTRDNYKNELLSHVNKNNKISLKTIKREVIPLISGYSDTREEDKLLNDKILQKTLGKFSRIRILLLNLDENKNLNMDILEKIDDEDKIFYENEANICLENLLLEETVILLAILQPISAFKLENLQSFLSYKKLNYRLPHIKNELKKLKNQINDYRFNRIQLLNASYASYIVNDFFSESDIQEFVLSIYEWIIHKKIFETDFICKFIFNIEKNKIISQDTSMKKIDELINVIEDNTILFDIAISLTKEYDLLKISVKFFEKAANQKHADSLHFLGKIYLKGNKLKKDFAKAEYYFLEASKLDHIDSKLVLSSIYFKGKEIEKNSIKGMTFLNEAIELGSDFAKYTLGVRLLLGIDVIVDIDKGNNILEDLVQLDFVDAIRIMGNKYIYGDGLEKNNEKGIELLKRAIEKGSKLAKLELSRFLIQFSSSDNERSEGIKMLYELVEENHIKSKRYLVNLLIKGIKVKKDEEKAIKILKELCETGHKGSKLDYAKLLIENKSNEENKKIALDIINELIEQDYINASNYLADILLEGTLVEKDTVQGINLLMIGVEKDNIDCIRNLALRYIYGDGVEKDIKKGKEFLEKALDKGDHYSRFAYAKLILEDENESIIETERAIELLKQSAKQGILSAKRYLGELLIEGEKLPKDIHQGILYMNNVIELGDVLAMRILGYRLLFGIDVIEDVERAIELLNNASDLGDTTSKTLLAYSIITKKIKGELSKGLSDLKECSEIDPIAMRYYAIFNLNNMYELADQVEGERLLKLASERGNKLASFDLAKMFLDGFILKQDIVEGTRILLELVNAEYEDAIIEYCQRLISGAGFDKNPKLSLELLKKYSYSSLDIKYYYAMILIRGTDNVVKNVEKGNKILREASMKGHEESRGKLAQLLIEGTLSEEKEEEAMELFEISIENKDSVAMFYLGTLYLNGIKVERNIEKGIDLLKNAIELNNLESKLYYARMLLSGNYIKRDLKKGLELLKELSNQGDFDAKLELAELFIEGKMVQQKRDEGLAILSYLVEMGDEESKSYLAEIYIYGDFIEKNVEKGIELYEELIIKEHSSSIINYAELLIEGIFLNQNLRKGEQLLKNLAQLGNGRANYLLAIRYLNKDVLKKHISNGKNRLEKSIHLNYEGAKFEKAIRLKTGNKFTKDEKKANLYIAEVLDGLEIPSKLNLGIISYHLNDFIVSTKLFYESYLEGFYDVSISLAYMIRRKEIKGLEIELSLLDLLKNDLEVNSTTAIINLALSFAIEDVETANWYLADSLIRSLPSCNSSISWWLNSSLRNDDPEGHLVIGWLMKYKKIHIHGHLKFTDKLKLAQNKGIKVPNWLFE